MPMILVSAPVPLGQIGFYNLLGLGWGFWTKGLGPGLDIHSVRMRCHCRRQDQESFDSV